MKNIHFIGIGGISMSGLAQIYREKGYSVTGSDRRVSGQVQHLLDAGFDIAIGQKAENIKPEYDTIVYTAAIHEDNPELMAARALAATNPNVRVMTRAELLGSLVDEYPNAIAVAGTHGKTSTSSMLSNIYLMAKKDPTLAIGGFLECTGENFRVGKSETLILEACEYTESFLHFHPTTAVITNIEPEHLDYYGTYENLKNSFHKFVKGMRTGGTVVCGAENGNYFADYEGTVWTVSLKAAANWTAASIETHEDGLGSAFDIIFNGETLGRADIYVPGHHMIYDALCASAAAYANGMSFAEIKAGLAHYRSTKRRFEIKGYANGATIVDDFAHHPSQIKLTIEASKGIPHKDLYIAFQPHTYTRTRDFLNEFADALALADHVVLTDIWGDREADTGLVHAKDLLALLQKKGVDAAYFPTYDEVENFLLTKLSTDDMLITMGLGDVYFIAEGVIAKA